MQNHRGGLMLIDARNTVIGGVNYDWSPDDVIGFCATRA
jgi:hypothetical protein